MELFSIKIRCTFQLVSTHQGGKGGTFHCYHFHIRLSFVVSAAKFGNKQKGL